MRELTLNRDLRVRLRLDRALLAALTEPPCVSAPRVTIPRGSNNAPLAGGSRSRVPASPSLFERATPALC